MLPWKSCIELSESTMQMFIFEKSLVEGNRVVL